MCVAGRMRNKLCFYFRTFYSFTQSGPRVYVYGCVHSQRKCTYVLRITRSCFLEWVGREMATWIGHVEMGTGREEGGGGLRHAGGGEGATGRGQSLS